MDLLGAVIVGHGCEAGSARGPAVVVEDHVVDSFRTVHGSPFRREDWMETAVVGKDIDAHVLCLSFKEKVSGKRDRTTCGKGI